MRKNDPFDEFDEFDDEMSAFREDLKAFYQSTGNDFSATDEAMAKRGFKPSTNTKTPAPRKASAKKLELPTDWWKLSDEDAKILAEAGIKVE
jgi:hypothetical protein